jgi:hypothetical protein
MAWWLRAVGIFVLSTVTGLLLHWPIRLGGPKGISLGPFSRGPVDAAVLIMAAAAFAVYITLCWRWRMYRSVAAAYGISTYLFVSYTLNGFVNQFRGMPEVSYLRLMYGSRGDIYPVFLLLWVLIGVLAMAVAALSRGIRRALKGDAA